MGKRSLTTIVAVVIAVAALAGGAAAASQYVITNIKQIKPSVLKKFQPALAYVDRLGPAATMCAAGTDTTGMCETGSSDARCPNGGLATGGGLDGGQTPSAIGSIGYNEPDSDGRGWHVIMLNDSSASATVSAAVVCIGRARGSFAADASVPAAVRAQIRAEVAALRATR